MTAQDGDRISLFSEQTAAVDIEFKVTRSVFWINSPNAKTMYLTAIQTPMSLLIPDRQKTLAKKASSEISHACNYQNLFDCWFFYLLRCANRYLHVYARLLAKSSVDIFQDQVIYCFIIRLRYFDALTFNLPSSKIHNWLSPSQWPQISMSGPLPWFDKSRFFLTFGVKILEIHDCSTTLNLANWDTCWLLFWSCWICQMDLSLTATILAPLDVLLSSTPIYNPVSKPLRVHLSYSLSSFHWYFFWYQRYQFEYLGWWYLTFWFIPPWLGYPTTRIRAVRRRQGRPLMRRTLPIFLVCQAEHLACIPDTSDLVNTTWLDIWDSHTIQEKEKETGINYWTVRPLLRTRQLSKNARVQRSRFCPINSASSDVLERRSKNSIRGDDMKCWGPKVIGVSWVVSSMWSAL